jgi:hypothetical protein
MFRITSLEHDCADCWFFGLDETINRNTKQKIVVRARRRARDPHRRRAQDDRDHPRSRFRRFHVDIAGGRGDGVRAADGQCRARARQCFPIIAGGDQR